MPAIGEAEDGDDDFGSDIDLDAIVDPDDFDSDVELDEVDGGRASLARPEPPGPEPSRPATVSLSEEQARVLSLVVDEGRSVFFTGAAGTGKSVLLRAAAEGLRAKHGRDHVAVTATTGLAACSLGGITLHCWAGIGRGSDGIDACLAKILSSGATRMRWRRTRVLVVDEVSMFDPDLFDKLDALARRVRGSDAPFGGIQLVLTGDFLQLPPVGRRSGLCDGPAFAFEAEAWTTCVKHAVCLRRVFRQRDPVFAGMLNEVREGRLTPASTARLRALGRPLPAAPDGVTPATLFATQREVDHANNARLGPLPGRTHRYQARDAGVGSSSDVALRLRECMYPTTLVLKQGVQVMLVRNVDEMLVNGAVGTVCSFMKQGEYVEALTAGNLAAATAAAAEREREQQGDPAPDEGAAGERPDAFDVLGVPSVCPVVLFALPDGSSRYHRCTPATWTSEDAEGKALASRRQIPLILAWALSIHKAQGQTLDRVVVNLTKVFECGQAYVALSRARSMDGLQVLGFDKSRIKVHGRVRAFYRGLDGVLAGGVAEGGGEGGEGGEDGEDGEDGENREDGEGGEDGEDGEGGEDGEDGEDGGVGGEGKWTGKGDGGMQRSA